VEWRFEESSLTAIDLAGVDWRDVLHVMGGRQRMIRRAGPVLWIIGQARDGRWLILGFVEGADEVPLLRGARWLDDEEAAAAANLLGGDDDHESTG
jgi:hypothetical protein